MSIIGDVLSVFSNNQNQAKQRALNYRLQQEQNSWNLDMWNKQNEYNLPANQINRLIAAGINPSALGGSPVEGNISNNIPEAAAPPFQDTLLQNQFSNLFPDELSIARYALDLKKTNFDMHETKRMNDKSNEKTDSEISLNGILGENYQKDTSLKEETINSLKQNIIESQKRISVLDSTIELNDANIAQMNALRDKYIEEKNWISYKAITERMNANSQRIIADSTKELNKKYGEKVDSDIHMTDYQIRNLVQQTRNLKKDGKLKDIELTYKGQQYKADIEIANANLKSIQIKNDIADKTKYAEVANAYINVVDNAAQTTSHTMRAVLDVSSGGATTILGHDKSGRRYEKDNPSFYGNMDYHSTGNPNPFMYSSSVYE